MGQILCVKKVPFRKSGHICNKIYIFSDTPFVYINNVIFSDLKNSSALYYFMNTCNVNLTSFLKVYNFTIIRNIGNPQLKMFHVVLYNWRCFDTVFHIAKAHPKHQHNQVDFYGYKFMNNKNMKSTIYIEPTSSRVIREYINILKCDFFKNINLNFVNVESKREIAWQLTNFVFILKTKYTL